MSRSCLPSRDMIGSCIRSAGFFPVYPGFASIFLVYMYLTVYTFIVNRASHSKSAAPRHRHDDEDFVSLHLSVRLSSRVAHS